MFYLVAAICAMAVVVIASLLIQRLRRGMDDGQPDGPTSGHTGGMLSALFLLAFAIAIVVPWTTADSARSNTYAESQAISEAYWSAARLPSPAREHTQQELRGYVTLVRGPEWAQMKHGRLSRDGWARLDRIRHDVIALPAGTDEVKDARTAVLDHLTEISAARHQRAMDVKAAPPPGLLVITALTGIVVVGLPFLAGARPRGMTLVPLTLMAALLAAGIYLTVDISHVFTGALAVGPDAYTNVQTELQRISEGG